MAAIRRGSRSGSTAFSDGWSRSVGRKLDARNLTRGRKRYGNRSNICGLAFIAWMTNSVPTIEDKHMSAAWWTFTRHTRRART